MIPPILAPSAPLGVVAVADSSTSVSVTWSEPNMPNGIITRYEVTYTRNDVMDAAMQQMNITSGTTVQLLGLDEFSNYTISVRGFTVALGEVSDPVTVRTNEDGESEQTTLLTLPLHACDYTDGNRYYIRILWAGLM
jgi:ephrin-B